jgi:p-cumate 2,3-dioxygenase subunit alpha
MQNSRFEVAARIVERFGEERAWRMCDTVRLFLIYPVRLTVYALAPNEESKEQLDLRLNNFVSFLGPGGFAHPDDLEAIESCQDSFRSREVEWSDFSRGMRREPELMDELPIRAFWRQWHAQIMGDKKAMRVDDLPFAGTGGTISAK